MPKQRGSSWQADVMIDGKRVRKAFKTEKEAQQYEQDHSKIDTSIRHLFPSIGNELWAGTKDYRNASRICLELVNVLGATRDITEIAETHVEAARTHFKGIGNSARTINTKLTRLSKLMKQARRKLGHSVSVPEIGLERETGHRTRFLTPVEEADIRERIVNGAHKRFFDFLLYTGCRFSEGTSVTWRDVSKDRVTFWLTKSDKPRTVPLSSKAFASIRWDEQRSLKKPFSDVDYQEFYRDFKQAVKAVGLVPGEDDDEDEKVTPHTLRHTCASRLVQRGVDIRRVRDWLGHSDISMTMRYAQLAPDDLFSVVSVLEDAA